MRKVISLIIIASVAFVAVSFAEPNVALTTSFKKVADGVVLKTVTRSDGKIVSAQAITQATIDLLDKQGKQLSADLAQAKSKMAEPVGQ